MFKNGSDDTYLYGKKLRSISDHWSNVFFGLDGASKNSNLKSAVDLICKPEFSIYLIIFSQQDLGNNCDHYKLWSTLKFNVMYCQNTVVPKTKQI